MKKTIALFLAIVVLCTSGAKITYAADKIVEKKQTLTFNVYDSIITSWKLIAVKGTFEWSYNKTKRKLTKSKDISHSVPTCVIGCFAKNFKESYPWWNTSKNNSGKAKLSFTYGVGLDTSWISIAQKKSAWMAVTAYGKGTHSNSFSD